MVEYEGKIVNGDSFIVQIGTRKYKGRDIPVYYADKLKEGGVGMAEYIRIGDKVLKVERYELVGEKRIPVIKAESEETVHPDGRVDVTVKVPCLHLGSKQETLNN